MSEAIAVSTSPPPASQASTSAAVPESPKAIDNKGENKSGDRFSKLVSEHTDKQTDPTTHHADGEQTKLQADIPGGNPLPQALPSPTVASTTTLPDTGTTAVLASVATAEVQSQAGRLGDTPGGRLAGDTGQAGKLSDTLGGRLAGDTGQADQKSLPVSSPGGTRSGDTGSSKDGRMPGDTMMRHIQAGVLVSNGEAQAKVMDASLQEQKAGQHLQVTINSSPARGDGLYALSQSTVLNHQPPGAEARTGQVSVQLNTPFSQADWGNALTARVAWQTGQGIQQARILVNPPELGPIQVNVSIHHDQASVQFVAHHGAVRHAIEQAMPQLRDMLAQSGMTLTDANVSQHAPGDQQFSGSAFSEGAAQQSGSGVEGLESGDVVVELHHARAHALLDAYA